MKKQNGKQPPVKSVIRKGDPKGTMRTMEIKKTDPKPTTWGGKVPSGPNATKNSIPMSDPRHPEYNSLFNKEVRKREAEKKKKSSPGKSRLGNVTKMTPKRVTKI